MKKIDISKELEKELIKDSADSKKQYQINRQRHLVCEKIEEWSRSSHDKTREYIKTELDDIEKITNNKQIIKNDFKTELEFRAGWFKHYLKVIDKLEKTKEVELWREENCVDKIVIDENSYYYVTACNAWLKVPKERFDHLKQGDVVKLENNENGDYYGYSYQKIEETSINKDKGTIKIWFKNDYFKSLEK